MNDECRKEINRCVLESWVRLVPERGTADDIPSDTFWDIIESGERFIGCVGQEELLQRLADYKSGKLKAIPLKDMEW